MFKSNTMTILIGNTDNKLTQQEWHDFIFRLRTSCKSIVQNEEDVHFIGGSSIEDSVQNYVIVLSLETITLSKKEFYKKLKEIKEDYNQDSIAVVEGKTKFI